MPPLVRDFTSIYGVLEQFHQGFTEGDSSFSTRGEILSGPAALCGSSCCNKLRTPSSVTFMSGNVGFVLGPLEGIVDVSSFEKTEQYCWFSIFAFPLASEIRTPDLSGETLHVSFFLDFT